MILSKLKSSKKFNIRWSLVRINEEDQGPYLELVKQNLETDAHNLIFSFFRLHLFRIVLSLRSGTGSVLKFKAGTGTA